MTAGCPSEGDRLKIEAVESQSAANGLRADAFSAAGSPAGGTTGVGNVVVGYTPTATLAGGRDATVGRDAGGTARGDTP